MVSYNIFQNDDFKSFLDAADYIKDFGVTIKDSMLKDLQVAISVRKKYSERLTDRGDEGVELLFASAQEVHYE